MREEAKNPRVPSPGATAPPSCVESRPPATYNAVPGCRASRSVGAESRHNPDAGSSGPAQWSPWSIAVIALLAALFQVVASVALGLARLDSFAAAANEGPQVYLLAALLTAAAGYSIWLVRGRRHLALALAAIWPLGLWYGLRGRTTALGLAYHGEFILHHFAALLCFVLAVAVPLRWAGDRRLGKLRALPLVLAAPGALALAGAHLGRLPLGPPWLAQPWLATAGGAALLAAWPVAAALFWRHSAPGQRRPITWVLLVPVLVRLGFAGPAGLSGALIPAHAVPWLGAAIVMSAIATLVLLRPRTERWVLAVIGLVCLLASAFFYYLYEHGFGELEDGLSGLLQSLFGFRVPYPPYADDLRSAALMMGLFFVFVTVYAALVSAEDRVRGVALALMVVAGLGFSSPHLVTMLTVGGMLFVESLLPGAPNRDVLSRDLAARLEREFGLDGDDPGGEPGPLEATFAKLAERLGFAAPTTVETESGATLALRGQLAAAVDLRARVRGSGRRLDLAVGLRGRGAPLWELVPDAGQRGQRPAHLLARSHRVSGELRALEDLGDAPLDALVAFPRARLRAWEAGFGLELDSLEGLEVDELEAVIRALDRALAR